MVKGIHKLSSMKGESNSINRVDIAINSDDIASSLLGFFPESMDYKYSDIGVNLQPVHRLEEECTRRFCSSRRREFIVGRMCARYLLERIGVKDFPLLVGDSRSPLWPEGIVGSITHQDSHCLVIAGGRDCNMSVGVDVETIQSIDCDSQKQLFTKAEIEFNSAQHKGSESSFYIMAFSIKEAIFKCLYPLVREYIEFHDVQVWIRKNCTIEVQISRKIEAFKYENVIRVRARLFETFVIALAWISAEKMEKGIGGT